MVLYGTFPEQTTWHLCLGMGKEVHSGKWCLYVHGAGNLGIAVSTWKAPASRKLGYLQGRQATTGVCYLSGTWISVLPEGEEFINHHLRKIMSGPNLAEPTQ